MATGERKDPFRGYKFKLEVNGITRAGFREASGLDAAQDPVEYAEISLKRGVTDDAELWTWWKTSLGGRVERKNGSIVRCDGTGKEKVRWNFVGGRPTKWTGPTFIAAGNEVAIETLEIAHEGVTKA
jgi:T4-like virus tail tube protein gp19